MFWDVELDPEDVFDELYTKPTPSLCDHCERMYFLDCGSAVIGRLTYRLRYCSEIRQGIHFKGFQECQVYKAKT